MLDPDPDEMNADPQPCSKLLSKLSRLSKLGATSNLKGMMRLGHLYKGTVSLVLQDLDAHHVAVRPEHVEYCSNIRHLLRYHTKLEKILLQSEMKLSQTAPKSHLTYRRCLAFSWSKRNIRYGTNTTGIFFRGPSTPRFGVKKLMRCQRNHW